jgi:alcohol dehydrogenase
MNGEVKFGDTVAILGAGPVGLAALMTAQFYSPAEIIVVDLDENRLKKAADLGATLIINNSDGHAAQKVMAFTHGKGVDVAIEVVGHPATCELCQNIIGAGGHIADIGVYSKSVELNKHILWTKNITLRLGTVNTITIPLLMKTVQKGKLDPQQLITHHFDLNEIMRAYDVFMNAAQEQAIKIILTNKASGANHLAASTAQGMDEAARQILVEKIVAQVLQAHRQG